MPCEQGEFDTRANVSVRGEEMPKATTWKNENRKHLSERTCREMTPTAAVIKIIKKACLRDLGS